MFPFFENLTFWVFTAAVCVIAYVATRRHVRKQLATATKASLRSPMQRSMHWASLLLLCIPLGYVILINGKQFWAAFAVLWVQAGSMFLLRLLGVAYAIRIWLLVPVVAVSALIGAVITVWPYVSPSTLYAAPWLFLVLTAFAFALSSVISLYSFPIGYGERAR